MQIAKKMKRYHILLVGMIGMVIAPLLSLLTQSVATDEGRLSDFDFTSLINSSVWNNATIFMPIIFTLIGGYLINREYTDDTLKSVLTVPVSFRKLLTGKLLAVALLTILLGIYSFAVTVLAGLITGLNGLSLSVVLQGAGQMILLSLCTYIVVLPIITICGRKQGSFMGGAIVAFILGYCSMLFKSGILRNIYPFLATFTVIRFDPAVYMNTHESGSCLLGVMSLGTMLILSILLIIFSKPADQAGTTKESKDSAYSLRPAQRAKVSCQRKRPPTRGAFYTSESLHPGLRRHDPRP